MKNHLIKKSLIVLSTTVAFANMPLAVELPKLEALDYVPAKTAMFSGSLTGFSLRTYIGLNEDLLSAGKPEGLDEIFNGEESSAVFFSYIFENYYDTVGDADKFMKHYGFAEEARFLFYTVDFNPVIRYEAADPTAIWKVLDAAAADADVEVVEKEMDGVKYKSYHLNNKKADGTDFIVAMTGDWVTMTFALPDAENKHLKVALGIEKPAKSLNQTTILQDLADKYEFDGMQLGYIDHEAIVNKITSTTPISFIDAEDWNEMSDMQTPACQAEFAAIAKSWPRTVVGSTSFTLNEAEYLADSKIIFESTNKQTNDALMSLRGFIPAHVGGAADKVFGVAFGVNTDNVTTSLTQLWSSVTQAKYECEPLLVMQENLAAANPAALGMFTGMAQGVMGLSTSVFEADIDMSEGQPKFNKLDLLVSLAAQSPAAQVATGTMMAPPLRGLKIPEDGTPIVLNEVLPPVNMIGGKTLAAIVGKHLNIYQGDKAAKASGAMKDEAIDANGFFKVYMHYGKFFKTLAKVLEDGPDPLPKELKVLENSDIEFDMDVDFTENGIEMSANIELRK